MRLFEFVKWWWNRNDIFTRVIVCFLILWVIPCVISTIWIGKFAFELILIGVISIMALGVVGALLCVLMSMWTKFNEEVPTDDVKIIKRLKGE